MYILTVNKSVLSKNNIKKVIEPVFTCFNYKLILFLMTIDSAPRVFVRAGCLSLSACSSILEPHLKVNKNERILVILYSDRDVSTKYDILLELESVILPAQSPRWGRCSWLTPTGFQRSGNPWWRRAARAAPSGCRWKPFGFDCAVSELQFGGSDSQLFHNLKAILKQ